MIYYESSACGGQFSTPSGIIRSPYHPANYPQHRQCTYLISAPAGNVIQLQFSDFDVEGSWNCRYDFLEIRDGDNQNSTVLGRYCGDSSLAPDLVTSSYNYLYLTFVTDGSVQNRGFILNYTTIQVFVLAAPRFCLNKITFQTCSGEGGILRESSGLLRSPAHPSQYPHGVDCRWIISAQPGFVVRLSWLSFSLEGSSRCQYDSVSVWDNSSIPQAGGLMGRYCGTQLPPDLTSSDNLVTVIFSSDHSIAGEGFTASYMLLDSRTHCGGTYTTDTGVLRSPGYPDPYPHSRTCEWVVRVQPGRQIRLNVTEFDLESHSNCNFDYLEIR